MSRKNFEEMEGGVVLLEAAPKVKEPPLYQVYLVNDDYTPMEFVVEVLERFFFMSRDKATTVMLQVHRAGKGICGVFTRDVAETKVNQVNEYARHQQQPLLCGMETV
jgi:ATP-dependent Clp protease adaptor protein ClpS